MQGDTLICSRRAGFRTGLFSECSCRLQNIVNYVNQNKKMPAHVDSSKLFKNFRRHPTDDVSGEYFDDPKNVDLDWSFDNAIDYYTGYQYSNYQTLDFEGLNPLIKKFFSPSEKVKNIIKGIEKKYSLDYNNLCVLLYRGNDKAKETGTPLHSELFEKAEQHMKKNPNVTFLIQSDETEFLREGEAKFSNSLVLYDEIKHIDSNSETQVHRVHSSTKLADSINYLAITYIISKSKAIIGGTGNCNIWPCLFRGDADKVYQYCRGFYKSVRDNFGVYRWKI